MVADERSLNDTVLLSDANLARKVKIEGGEVTGLGASLESFKEADEIADIIAGLQETIEDGNKHEQAVDRFKCVLDWYQEQPHLLDPHLERLLELLVARLRSDTPAPLLHATTRLMAHLFKVRGPKVVVRHLPHEVEDLERVVAVLQAQDPTDNNSWETRYLLLLWLSIIVLIPFNMARFDSGERAPLSERLLALCQRYLGMRDKCQDAAASLVATFLTRPDTRDTLLPTFLDWTLRTLSDGERPEAEITGALKAVCAVTKHAKREDLVCHAGTVMERLQSVGLREHNNTIIRKLGLKLVQRLGLVFLKAKVASWRYQRGSRSLALNLNQAVPVNIKGDGAEKPDKLDLDEDYDIPDEVEDVIEELLEGLKDKDTIVRWSAAKGVGRVTGRLPQHLADEVVGSLLGLFEGEMDCGWHGGCLALAELGRRGLLLPTRLPQVVPRILTALVYDEKKGSFSVGAHIRDAACYVCWAFARAYDPLVLKPHVGDIAAQLLTVAVFDREVNCRRAASAAFQENVGRQGTFPHGIEILTVADYHAVGSRQHCYTELSVMIAGYSEYSGQLVSHLLERKVGHWDGSCRELTARALGRLVSCKPDLARTSLLPTLLDRAVSPDLHTSHGAVLAAGEVVAGLAAVAAGLGTGLAGLLGTHNTDKVAGLLDRLVEKHKLRGLGGEIMRQAAADYVKNVSLSGLTLQPSTVAAWLAVLEESLASPEVAVQQAAVTALPAFLDQNWAPGGQLDTAGRDRLLAVWQERLQAGDIPRRGFSAALGALPGSLLRGREEELLLALIRAARITEGTEKWAEARREAVRAVGAVTAAARSWLAPNLLPHVMDCFLLAFEDYTVDRRGDTGAWVREAAMAGVEVVAAAGPIPASLVAQVMPCLAQQATEKIARTRGQAGRVFHALLWSDQPGIPAAETLRQIFPREADINWTVEAETFPLWVRLLELPDYLERVLLGLVVSTGGLTERLVRSASQALFAQLRSSTPSTLNNFTTALLAVFKQYQKVDRITVPLFKFLEQLLTSACLAVQIDDPASQFSFQLFSLCKAEVSKSGDPNKIMASSEVFCQLLQAGDQTTVKKCLVQLSIFLCHKFPRVRKSTAEKLYEALLTFSDREIVPEEVGEEVMALLLETQWDSSVDQLRPVRNKICALAGVAAPTPLKQTPA